MSEREVVLDTETTGLDPLSGHKIIEIACVEIFNKVRTGRFFHTYLNPKRDVSEGAFRVHGISTEFLKNKKEFHEVVDEFQEFLDGSPLVIHNAKFDMGFINHEISLLKREIKVNSTKIIDTLEMARRQFPGSPANLDALCRRFSIDNKHRTKHGALIDAEILADVYMFLCGGSQLKMNYEFKPKQEKPVVEVEKENIEMVNLKKREFLLEDEEIEMHSKMLKKIKDNIW
jgi:DNA polymerase-3 subunit epsilon